MRKRLSLDIGTNSIGWAVLGLDENDRPATLIETGVRIFRDGRDPQSGTSLAVDRRIARGMRKRRDRYLKRRDNLMEVLIAAGLMPEGKTERRALEREDPYEIRRKALDDAVPLHHLGRALFHLDQRRGFKSNRKSDADKNEKGRVKSGIKQLHARMQQAGARTYGEFLAVRHAEREPVRARLRGTGKDEAYDFYPERSLVQDEFDALWEAQAPHHPELTAELRTTLRDEIIFYQRKLRPVRPGRCRFISGEERAPWALPSAQEFRILQEVNNLEGGLTGEPARRLTEGERDIVRAALLGGGKQSFDQLRRKLKLPGDFRFNLESAVRTELKGDATADRLGSKKLLGKAWAALTRAEQDGVVERLDGDEDEAGLIAWLQDRFGIDAELAERVADATLPDGHCSIGRTALAKLIPLLRQGKQFHAAATEAFRSHSEFFTGEVLDRLPYYGEVLPTQVGFGSGEPADPEDKRYGRVPNPTVHIALNQLRRVANALIERHEAPYQIVLELARDLKMNAEQQQKKENELRENFARNERLRKDLAALGQQDTRENLQMLKLWEELSTDPRSRCCPYTGETIGLSRLFSGEVEVDHILPFSKTLDDSLGNKTVALRRANRDKGNKSPFQAFGDDRQAHRGYVWAEIAARAALMPRGKPKLFLPDALEKFESTFLDRQLNETRWMSRLAREYLRVLGPKDIWVVTGRLTALLRGKWGLNSILPRHNRIVADPKKDRTDHRHHAIDAVVIGAIDRSLLQRLTTEAARSEEQDLERLFVDGIPEPFAGWRDAVAESIRRIQISHRLDHGTAGKLHKETAYGLIAPENRREDEEAYNLVYRKPLAGLNDNEIARIRDLELRAAVQDYVAAAKARGEKPEPALVRFKHPRNGSVVRRVRLLETEKEVVEIRDQAGEPFKAYSPGENYAIDIYWNAKGRWAGRGLTVFAANQPGRGAPALAGKRVMRVRKGDLVRLNLDGQLRLMRVARLDAMNNRLKLANHTEAGKLDRRHADPEDPFRWTIISYEPLRAAQARLVKVDEIGRVLDPGPHRPPSAAAGASPPA